MTTENELNFVNENTSVVSFHLAECEFHPNSGSEMFSAGQILNNGANTFVGTSFGFTELLLKFWKKNQIIPKGVKNDCRYNNVGNSYRNYF